MYGLNLERRILDKILYEVDSSDIPVIPKYLNCATFPKHLLTIFIS
jgi:hypothetical protein